DRLGLRAIPFRDRHERDALNLLQARQVTLLGDAARADEPDPHALAGHRSPPRSDTIPDAGWRLGASDDRAGVGWLGKNTRSEGEMAERRLSDRVAIVPGAGTGR